MAFFRITITLKTRVVKTGIRELDLNDIDNAWLGFKSQAEDFFGYGNIEDFQTVQLSKHSPEVKLYLQKRKPKNR